METLLLLIMKHIITIKLSNISLSGKTRRSFSTTNFVDYCFFCDDVNWTLLSCLSKNLDKHVSKWAWLHKRVKSKRNDEKSEKELFTVVGGSEWKVFLSISGSPIFCSIAHSLCLSETTIHSATHCQCINCKFFLFLVFWVKVFFTNRPYIQTFLKIYASILKHQLLPEQLKNGFDFPLCPRKTGIL